VVDDVSRCVERGAWRRRGKDEISDRSLDFAKGSRWGYIEGERAGGCSLVKEGSAGRRLDHSHSDMLERAGFLLALRQYCKCVTEGVG
jgi:hypothetical protein